MVDQILLYLGAALPFFWGVAHLFPTRPFKLCPVIFTTASILILLGLYL